METELEANTPLGTLATATEFDYDQMGRAVKHRQAIGTQIYPMEYGYNLAGQLTSEKYPSGKVVSIGYDTKGRLAQIADQSRTYLNSLQYQGKGNSLNQMSFGNGTIQSFTMNDRLQMTGQELKRGAEVLQKYDYGYGQIDTNGNLDLTKNNGQLAKVESHIGAAKQWTQKFDYDALGRLSASKEYRGDTNALSYKQKFDYDKFGNLYRKNASNPTAGQETPLGFKNIEETDINKATNRFTTETTYDDAGNVIVDSKFRTSNFSYDANGRMVKATRANVPDATSIYDASGMRVAEKVNDVWRFLIYDIGGKLIAEYGGLQASDEGGVKYLCTDWQGSTRAIVSNSGYVSSRMDYTAFGEDIQSGTGIRTTAQGFDSPNNNLRQKYGLTERDEATGLNHTWFRKNENKAGRWTSPDPYNGSMNLGSPQSFNRYSYVENQPTNYVDPSGLQMRYYDVSRGLACVVGADGRNHCIEYIDRYWYDDGMGNGSGSGSGNGRGWGVIEFEGRNIDITSIGKESKECTRIRNDIKSFEGFFAQLGSSTKSTGKEASGVAGFDVSGRIAGGYLEPPVARQYPGEGNASSTTPESSKWKYDQILGSKNEQVLFLYSVHTHPKGNTNPSTPKNNALYAEGAGDTIALQQLNSVGTGVLGIIVTADKIGVYNETGRICEFNR